MLVFITELEIYTKRYFKNNYPNTLLCERRYSWIYNEGINLMKKIIIQDIGTKKILNIIFNYLYVRVYYLKRCGKIVEKNLNVKFWSHYSFIILKKKKCWINIKIMGFTPAEHTLKIRWYQLQKEVIEHTNVMQIYYIN